MCYSRFMPSTIPSDPHIYFLISKQEHQEALLNGTLQRPSLHTEGFLHASPADQLTRVANKHYRDTAGTRVLVVAIRRITPEVRWEPATGGLYPHIYGPLNMDAVDYAVPAPRDPDRQYRIRTQDLDAGRAL